MSKSIFEMECDRLQPILLERVSILTKSESNQMAKYALENFSYPYATGFVQAYCDIFNKIEKENGRSKIKFSEAIECIIKYKRCSLFFEGYCAAIAKIYGMTYEEVTSLIDKKEYWMSYGTK